MRNIIINEKHEKLKIIITKRKAILSDKRKIINKKYILIMSKIYDFLIKWRERKNEEKKNYWNKKL